MKTLLVSKYFWAWAKVMIGAQKRFRPSSNKIAYIDLFAGPGRYKNDTRSTPLMILQTVIDDPEMSQRLVTIFNDKDESSVDTLQNEILQLTGIEKLKHKPIILNEVVGEELVKTFKSMKLIPTLCFIDPWGYKGLSLGLVDAVIKDFGCDCIFFFNYNRINMGLNNEYVDSHINELFGQSRADVLREKIESVQPKQREFLIVNEICQALKDLGGKYVLPFCFKNKKGDRTSHHLIFVSKHVKGYEIMKSIMASHSSTSEQGVASFDFNPARERQLEFLFNLSRPLEELSNMLLDGFAGQSIKMKDIYKQHHVDTPFISKNYKDALSDLEGKKLIICDPPASKRQRRNGKRTFGDNVSVTFSK